MLPRKCNTNASTHFKSEIVNNNVFPITFDKVQQW